MIEVIDLTDKKITLDKFGNADILTDKEAEKQILKNALLIFRGGWFADTTRGPNWLKILQKQFNINQIKSDIRRVLNTLPIVSKIINISLGPVNENREVELTIVVMTTSDNIITFADTI